MSENPNEYNEFDADIPSKGVIEGKEFSAANILGVSVRSTGYKSSDRVTAAAAVAITFH